MSEPSQGDCEVISLESLRICRTKPGAYCVFANQTTEDYQCSMDAGLGRATTYGNVTCSNTTTAEFCPEGNHCTGGRAYPCQIGYYCPIGSSTPLDCPFSALGCPLVGSAFPLEGVVFGMLLLIFTITFSSYWAFGNAQIQSDNDRKWVKVARVASLPRYDAMNGLILEHDQHVVVQTTGDIFEAMAARERAVTSAKWQDVLDISTSRFSADLRGMENSNVLLNFSPDSRDGPSPATGNNRMIHARLTIMNPAGIPMASPERVAILSPGGHRTRRLSVEGGKKGKLAREGSRLMGKLQASMQHFDYQEVEVPLTVAFTHMYLKLKATDTVILSDICLSIKPFHVTAIMGPSGAGKTSLLSLLRGQAHYADISGSLTVNGHAVESLEPFRRRTAYVPQDDIVNDELSTEENILYSALLFNRRGYLTAEECMPMVLQAEKLLDISHIRTSVVGSSEKRGISGGQKKRVSIGMELMKEAELFFLDEPTSGLDSASSMLVINALHFLAAKGVTVSTTIHQPRQEILNLMDNLVLLAPGGRVAYYGHLTDVHAHFSSLHYTCPPGTNIADFVMDVLCGFVPLDNSAEVQPVQTTIDYVCDWWAEHKYPEFRSANSVRISVLRQLSDVDTLTAVPPPKGPVQRWRFWRPVQMMKIFWTCFLRQARVNYRTLRAIGTTCGLVLVFGIIVAFLIGPLALDGTGGSVSTFSAQITSGCLVFTLLVQAASLRLFSHDQLLRDREFKAGVSVAPYYLGKLVGNYAEGMFYAFAFLVGYYPFLKARAPFIRYFYVFLLLHISVAGLVNLISVAYPGSSKGTFAVGVVVLLWSFGGVSPSLEAMESSMSVFATIVNYISPFKYAFTVEIINELSMYPDVWEVENFYDKLGYQATDQQGSVIALVIYFLVTNFLAYLCAEVKQISPKQRRAMADKVRATARRCMRSISSFSSRHFSTEQSSSSGSPSNCSAANSSADGQPLGPTPPQADTDNQSANVTTGGTESTSTTLRPSSILRHESAFGDNSSKKRRDKMSDKTVRWIANPVDEIELTGMGSAESSEPGWDLESQSGPPPPGDYHWASLHPVSEDSPDRSLADSYEPEGNDMLELTPLSPGKEAQHQNRTSAPKPDV